MVSSKLNMSLRGKVFKQRYYRDINTLSICRPVLLSCNVQSEHVVAEEKLQTTILLEHFTLRLCRPVLLSGNFQSENVAAGKVFKQRYYRNLNTLSLCRPVLLSGNVQSEHVATPVNFQTTILSEP